METKDYWDELIHKLLNKEYLTESEIQDLVYEYDEYKFEESKGENKRWTRSVSTILRIPEHFETVINVESYRFFEITWEEGLTEGQEDEFDNQPIEVRHAQTRKMVEVITNNYEPI